MTLVLVGGLGTTAAIWEPQLETLEDSIAFDLPGHGTEPLPDGEVTIASIAASLLERLPPRFSFCGLSMGGMVGMWIAANAPERINRLVLACTGAKLGERADYEERAERVRREGVGVVVDGARERWFTPAFRDTPAARRVVDALAASDPEGYAACCAAVGRFDFRDELDRIRTSALLLFGEHDPVTTPDVRETLRDGIRDVRTAEIAGAAHLACVEQPDAFTDQLRSAGMSHEEGMKTRREVLGDEHVDRAIESTTDLTRDFQDFITRYAWGEVWARPGLDRRMRSAITLTALIALGRDHELGMHVRAALRNGLTADEIGEVILHSAVYCGVPAANRAFAIAQDVLDEPSG